MKEKEKAQELFNKFYGNEFEKVGFVAKSEARTCSLIVVNEILKEFETRILSGRPSHLDVLYNYWINVKVEINNL